MEVFTILTTRIVEKSDEKKYVAYIISVKSATDVAPTFIERRYTDFLELHNNIRRDSSLLPSYTFPKKVLLGNFSTNVIEERKASFQKLLNAVLENEGIRNNPAVYKFLVGPEENEAIKLLHMKKFSHAKPLLVNIFTVLNKVYTDRHPGVLRALCRLVACCNADPCALLDAERYGELALRRYEIVSDVDLLRFYVPLLQMCLHLWWTVGRDKKLLEARLEDLRRRGHRVDGAPKLLDALLATES